MPKQGESKSRKAQTKAKRKYNASSYDTITIFVTKGDKEIIKERAISRGSSMNEYIKKAIYDRMKFEDEMNQ